MIFLKLGGSLITDKDRPLTVRPDALRRLAGEIAAARAERPNQLLLIGHGSGSFGHSVASTFNTRAGVQGQQAWRGFAAVWQAARALNQLVCEALAEAGLPVVAFPPSASALATDGRISRWDTRPLQAALAAGLVPVIQGDVAFDDVRGGTILSTEECFAFLAGPLSARRMLLAGHEPGIWADFPQRQRLLAQLNPAQWRAIAGAIGGSTAVDVTGGMAEKARLMMDLVERLPDLEAQIFSGEQPGAVHSALLGDHPGTRLARDLNFLSSN